MRHIAAIPPLEFLGYLVMAIIFGLAFAGCATTLPAVAGKTHYNVEFSDTTAEQATVYKMDIKAPAGVDLATVTGMTYDWNPDGSGAISVSQQGNVDTKTQAAMITEVSRQQVEAFKAGLDSALNVLAPLLGPYLQSKDNRAAIDAQSEAERARMLTEMMDAKP